MKALSIHIPTPCHEDWQQMTPVDKGRFCQSCAKQVVDFSVMTDQEILNYISKASGSMCGRFADDQLQRPLQPMQQERKKVWWIAAMMPLLMLFEKAGAQKKDAKQQSQVVIPLNEQVSGMFEYGDPNKTIRKKITLNRSNGDSSFIIEGHVIRERTREPVSYVRIELDNKTQNVTTGLDGNFVMHGNTKKDNALLKISSVGFNDTQVYISLKDTEAIQPADNYTINGNVADEITGDALPWASVVLKGSKIAVPTDTNGHFKLTIPSNNNKGILTISTVGYEVLEVPLMFNGSTGISNLDTIKLRPSTATLGEVVITGGMITCYRKPTKADTIPTLICKVFNKEKFKIFPSPAVKGSNVTVEIKNKGSYFIQLFDNNGKLLTAKPFEAVNDKAQTSIEIPASAVAGTYYIMLVDDKKKKQYTDKIIVM